MMRPLTLTAALALLLLSSGCSQPPRAEFDAASAALAEAEQAGAPRWAPAAWTAAQRAMDAAAAEIEQQKARSIFARTYDNARRLLVAAADAGREATAQADAARETALEEATAALAAIDATLEAIDEALTRLRDCPGRPASFAPTLVNFEGRRESLRLEREETDQLMQDDAFLEITERAAPLRTQSEALHAQVTSSLESLGC